MYSSGYSQVAALKAQSVSESELNESALAAAANDMTGAIPIVPPAPHSPKVMTSSSGSAKLQFNIELQPQ